MRFPQLKDHYLNPKDLKRKDKCIVCRTGISWGTNYCLIHFKGKTFKPMRETPLAKRWKDE